MPPTGRTRCSIPVRDDTGQYKRTCGINLHNESSPDSTTLINVKQGKKLKRKTKDFLYENGLISKKTKYVCKACVNNIENGAKNSETITEEQTATSQHGLPSLDTDVISEKCTDINEYLDKLIKSDIATLYNDRDKCNIDSLLSYNPAKWISECPPILVDLLTKLCGFTETPDTSQNFRIAKCIELIYGCRNKNIVLPLSFQENLLVYSLSRSKQLVRYNSKVSPSGSVETISKWMVEQASQPIPFPEGLVRSVFDNEQVIGKSHRVKADNKVQTSIITSHMNIILDPCCRLQNDTSFSPKEWLFQNPTEDQKNCFLQEDHKITNLFRQTRNSFIEERLESVVAEQQDNCDFLKDIIKKKDEHSKEKVCADCGAENDKSARKCTNCNEGKLVFENFDMSKYKKEINPYSHFSAIHTNENDFKIKTGEPDMCNPSSFQNISDILFNLAKSAGIKPYGDGNRKWLFVECDGGIYTIVEKLLFNVYHCVRCNEAIYGKDAFLEHKCCILQDVQPQHEFDWLIPMPGLLHVEMNACKAFVDLNWDVFVHDVCMKLGYRTPKALDCAKRCVDHHKTFKILEILYIAAADELLVPYIRQCREANVVPSVADYWSWTSNISNPNYVYMQQMIFTFLHSIMLFRIGCRRGNFDAILAGRNKLSLLFYGRNHTRYQQIMAMNKYIESMMPNDLKKVVLESFTLSRVGNIGHYQAGDACLEELNKEAKSWVTPRGTPSETEWQQVFRNLDNLNKVRKQFLGIAAGEGEKKRHSTTPAVDYNEMVPVRELFRGGEYDYLSVANDGVHTSLDGQKVLSDQLSNFTAEAEARQQHFFQGVLDPQEDRPQIPVVYITAEEKTNKEHISNQTKAEIQRKIFLHIDQLSEAESKLVEELFNKTVKGRNKESYLNFYHTLET